MIEVEGPGLDNDFGPNGTWRLVDVECYGLVCFPGSKSESYIADTRTEQLRGNQLINDTARASIAGHLTIICKEDL